MNINTLEGYELDMAVAKALGYKISKAKMFDNGHAVYDGDKHIGVIGKNFGPLGHLYSFSPSTKWDQCGPLIEKYKIDIDYDHDYKRWEAIIGNDGLVELDEWTIGQGPTPLIAVCRAIVASKK